ncbi:GNAT family N-acetyltransferase [Brachybacterium vulturis]|uniref:GNAT family N-acetyltransferase n=1 Tax=Brachybacterium vulturis TaxID=2017484 RepID=A0A291GS98_9MICO|nr:GNAT family N-acetyltransferase [Brachybacterium vulturis]ATG52866.1 GNAT family N-acetyltransferase [Brachybacterium vulturis]
MPRTIRLVPPSVTRYSEYLDCIADFAGTAIGGSGIRDPQQPPVADGDVIEFVTARLAEEDSDTELADGWVHCTSRWIIDAETEEMLGFIATRHRLNAFLLAQGGHIGYSVRPSARRQGIASAALELALADAERLGIDPVLVTCDDDNHGSRRTIEKAGGELEDVRDGKRRYWIGEGPRPHA